MKRQPLVLIGFTRYNGKGIVIKTNFIVDCMTGNILYGDAGTKLSDVSTALASYLAAAGNKGKALNYSEVKEAARAVLNATLKALGTYVSNKYPGNVSNWMTSGFDVQTFDGVTQAPAIPSNVKVKDSEKSGEALLTFDKAPFAAYYEGRNWKKGESEPHGMTGTSKNLKILYDGMTPGETYYFQVRARGTKGVSDWSQAVTFIVR